MTTGVPTHTPWGTPQTSREIAAGVIRYHCHVHGGFWLSKPREQKRRDRFPDFRPTAGPSWYEEDQDAVIVFLTLPQLFDEDHMRAAVKAVRAFANRPAHTIAVRGWRGVIDWL